MHAEELEDVRRDARPDDVHRFIEAAEVETRRDADDGGVGECFRIAAEIDEVGTAERRAIGGGAGGGGGGGGKGVFFRGGGGGEGGLGGGERGRGGHPRGGR